MAEITAPEVFKKNFQKGGANWRKYQVEKTLYPSKSTANFVWKQVFMDFLNPKKQGSPIKFI